MAEAYGTRDFINPPRAHSSPTGSRAPSSRAQAIADEKTVALCAADVAQQFLRAGLLDEIQVSVAPVLLGGGVRLFGLQKTGLVRLEQTRVVESDGVTHLRYRVAG